MENIYRLYSDKNSSEGKKIPYITKSLIIKLMKTIGKSKTVSCYIEHYYNSNKIPIVCEFNHDASISVTVEFKEPESESIISEIINKAVNPIILNVKKVFIK